MRIKIMSDGTVHGTTVLDADTGLPTDQVRRVTWSAAAGDALVTALVELQDVPVEVIGEVGK